MKKGVEAISPQDISQFSQMLQDADKSKQVAASMACERFSPEVPILIIHATIEDIIKKDPNFENPQTEQLLKNAEIFIAEYVFKNPENQRLNTLRQEHDNNKNLDDVPHAAFQALLSALPEKNQASMVTALTAKLGYFEAKYDALHKKRQDLEVQPEKTKDLYNKLNHQRTDKGRRSVAQDAAMDLKHELVKTWAAMSPTDFIDEGDCMKAIVDNHNATTNMIIEDMLFKTKSPKEVAKLFNFYLDVAEESFKIGNFHSGQAIVAALSGTALKDLRPNEFLSKKRRLQLEGLVAQVNPEGSNKALREAMAAHQGSVAIPPPDMFMKDIALTREGNKKKNADGSINLSLHELLGKFHNTHNAVQGNLLGDEVQPPKTDILERVNGPHLTEKFHYNRVKEITENRRLKKKFEPGGDFIKANAEHATLVRAIQIFARSTGDHDLTRIQQDIQQKFFFTGRNENIGQYSELLNNIYNEAKSIVDLTQKGEDVGKSTKLEILIADAYDWYDKHFPIPELDEAQFQANKEAGIEYKAWGNPIELDAVNDYIGEANQKAKEAQATLVKMINALKYKQDINADLLSLGEGAVVLHEDELSSDPDAILELDPAQTAVVGAHEEGVEERLKNPIDDADIQVSDHEFSSLESSEGPTVPREKGKEKDVAAVVEERQEAADEELPPPKTLAEKLKERGYDENTISAINHLNLNAAAAFPFAELIKTEQSYESTLNILDEQKRNKIRDAIRADKSPKHMTVEQFDTLLAKYDEIKEKQKSLRDILISPTPDFEAFVQKLDELATVYGEYNGLFENTPGPSDKVNICITEPSDNNNQPLKSLLILPAQRFPRYPLTCREFPDSFPEGDQRKAYYEDVLDRLQTITNKLNTATGQISADIAQNHLKEQVELFNKSSKGISNYRNLLQFVGNHPKLNARAIQQELSKADFKKLTASKQALIHELFESTNKHITDDLKRLIDFSLEGLQNPKNSAKQNASIRQDLKQRFAQLEHDQVLLKVLKIKVDPTLDLIRAEMSKHHKDSTTYQVLSCIRQQYAYNMEFKPDFALDNELLKSAKLQFTAPMGFRGSAEDFDAVIQSKAFAKLQAKSQKALAPFKIEAPSFEVPKVAENIAPPPPAADEELGHPVDLRSSKQKHEELHEDVPPPPPPRDANEKQEQIPAEEQVVVQAIEVEPTLEEYLQEKGFTEEDISATQHLGLSKASAMVWKEVRKTEEEHLDLLESFKPEHMQQALDAYANCTRAELRDCISHDELEAIFNKFTDIQTKHKELSNLILSPNPDLTQIADKMESLTQDYAKYSHLALAHQGKLPEKVIASVKVGNRNLAHFVTAPHTRNARYPSLLSELAKNAPEQQQPAIEACHAQISATMNKINRLERYLSETDNLKVQVEAFNRSHKNTANYRNVLDAVKNISRIPQADALYHLRQVNFGPIDSRKMQAFRETFKDWNDKTAVLAEGMGKEYVQEMDKLSPDTERYQELAGKYAEKRTEINRGLQILYTLKTKADPTLQLLDKEMQRVERKYGNDSPHYNVLWSIKHACEGQIKENRDVNLNQAMVDGRTYYKSHFANGTDAQYTQITNKGSFRKLQNNSNRARENYQPLEIIIPQIPRVLAPNLQTMLLELKTEFSSDPNINGTIDYMHSELKGARNEINTLSRLLNESHIDAQNDKGQSFEAALREKYNAIHPTRPLPAKQDAAAALAPVPQQNEFQQYMIDNLDRLDQLRNKGGPRNRGFGPRDPESFDWKSKMDYIKDAIRETPNLESTIKSLLETGWGLTANGEVGSEQRLNEYKPAQERHFNRALAQMIDNMKAEFAANMQAEMQVAPGPRDAEQERRQAIEEQHKASAWKLYQRHQKAGDRRFGGNFHHQMVSEQEFKSNPKQYMKQQDRAYNHQSHKTLAEYENYKFKYEQGRQRFGEDFNPRKAPSLEAYRRYQDQFENDSRRGYKRAEFKQNYNKYQNMCELLNQRFPEAEYQSVTPREFAKNQGGHIEHVRKTYSQTVKNDFQKYQSTVERAKQKYGNQLQCQLTQSVREYARDPQNYKRQLRGGIITARKAQDLVEKSTRERPHARVRQHQASQSGRPSRRLPAESSQHGGPRGRKAEMQSNRAHPQTVSRSAIRREALTSAYSTKSNPKPAKQPARNTNASNLKANIDRLDELRQDFNISPNQLSAMKTFFRDYQQYRDTSCHEYKACRRAIDQVKAKDGQRHFETALNEKIRELSSMPPPRETSRRHMRK